MSRFGWLFKLFRTRKRASRYVANTCCTKPTPTRTKTYDIKPTNVLNCGSSTINNTTCSCNCSTGYRKSPYSKNFKKPKANKHEYKPINTTFCCNTSPSICCTPEPAPAPVPAPVPPTHTCTNEPTPTLDTTQTCTCINFHETQNLVCGETNQTPAPTAATTSTTTCAQTVESNIEPTPAADFVTPKEGHLFVMNGYGVNIDVDGKKTKAFIDMGVDVNVKPGTKVLLHHHDGEFEGKTGVIIDETNTERNPSENQILIQKILDV